MVLSGSVLVCAIFEEDDSNLSCIRFLNGWFKWLDYCVTYQFLQSLGWWKVESGLYIILVDSQLLRSYKESLIYRMDDSWNKVGFLLYHHDVSHVCAELPIINTTTTSRHKTCDTLILCLRIWWRLGGMTWGSGWKKEITSLGCMKDDATVWPPTFFPLVIFLGPFLWMQSFKINTIQYLDTGRVSRVIGSKVPFFEVPFKHLRKPFTFSIVFLRNSFLNRPMCSITWL